MKTSKKAKLAAVVLPFALLIAACGSDSEGASTDDTTETTAAPADDMATTTEASADNSGNMGDEAAPEGDACAAVPADGSGSFSGMAKDPVATAASNNPELTTLVAAVTAADLGTTLNDAEAITVFAPINSAFEKIDKADLDALLADKDALTKVLTHHVVGERIEPADLGGEYETLAGDTIEVSGDAPAFDVSGQATVGCSGVQTANATVYLIDSVLMPA